MKRRFPLAVLWISALTWCGFGLMLMVAPERLDGVGLVVDSGLARIEVRGFYGGLELGLAAFLAWCARAPDRYRPGLLLNALAIGCTAAGRLVGVVLEGGETLPLMWGFIGLELTACALSVAALRTLRA